MCPFYALLKGSFLHNGNRDTVNFPNFKVKWDSSLFIYIAKSVYPSQVSKQPKIQIIHQKFTKVCYVFPLSGALWRIKDRLRTAFYVNEFEMENSDVYNKTYFMGRMG